MTFAVKLSESTAARRRMPVYMIDATDGYTPETGITSPTIEVSKNGGSQSSDAGSWGEVGDGVYYYELTTGEIDTLGVDTVRIIKSGTSREFVDVVHVLAYDPYDAAGLGLSRVDAAITTRSTLTQAQVLSDATPFAGANVGSILTETNSHPTLAEIEASTVLAKRTGSKGTDEIHDDIVTLDGVVSKKAGAKGTDAIYDDTITHPTLAEIEASAVLAKEASLTTINTIVTESRRIVKNKLTINTSTKKLELWNDAGAAVILSWDLTDKDGNPIVLTGTGPANRGVPS
jgi:hypothetical protein